nr:MAG TPA: hypothetical protein [Caudoviricetes sp.]
MIRVQSNKKREGATPLNLITSSSLLRLARPYNVPR